MEWSWTRLEAGSFLQSRPLLLRLPYTLCSPSITELHHKVTYIYLAANSVVSPRTHPFWYIWYCLLFSPFGNCLPLTNMTPFAKEKYFLHFWRIGGRNNDQSPRALTLLSLLHDDMAFLMVNVVQDPKGPDVENISLNRIAMIINIVFPRRGC